MWVFPLAVILAGAGAEAGFLALTAPCCQFFPSLVAGFVPFPSSSVSGQLVSAGEGCPSNHSGPVYDNLVVLVKRGNCSFYDKVAVAQSAGALAVVVYDSAFTDKLTFMSGERGLVIPAYFIGLTSGESLQQQLLRGGPVHVSINTTYVDRSAYYNANGGGGGNPSSHLATFGFAAVGVVGFFALYLAVYLVYHRLARREGKRLVRTIQYHKPANRDDPEAQPKPNPEALENGPVVQDVTEAQEETGPQEPAVFSIEVVREEDHPSLPSTGCCGSKPVSDPNNNHTAMFDLGGTCSICLEDFVEAERVFLLPCRHLFHEACVNEWLKRHGNCPNCKRDLDEAQENARATSRLASTARCLFHLPLSTMAPLLFICMAVCLVAAFCIVGAT